MDSQVVYEANATPAVKIVPSPPPSPNKENGAIPKSNGHANGAIPKANGHVANGHANGHIHTNGGLSPHKENGHVHHDHHGQVHFLPRSPRLGTPHRRQYVPLEANEDDDDDMELGEYRAEGKVACNEKMMMAMEAPPIEQEEPPKDR